MSSEIDRARFALVGITVGSYAAVFGLAAGLGLRVDYGSIWPSILWFGGATILLAVYCGWRSMPALRNTIEPVGLGMVMTVPTVLSTYLAIGTGMPLADEPLAALDAALGFEWLAFVGYVDGFPWLAYLLGLCYQSFAVQLLLLPVLVALFDRADHAYRMVAAYALICLAASVIAIWFPALGAYPHYGIGPDKLENINIHFGYFFLEQFNGVRDNPDFLFSMSEAAGILTFPSVHAAVAALCVWSTWGIVWLRFPVLVLNLGMAVSAVSHGSHYLVDVPAGIMLAIACIGAICVVTRPTQGMTRLGWKDAVRQ